MVCTRDLRGRFKPSTEHDVAKIHDWATAWFVKHQPEERAVEQMHAAFVAFLDSDFACAPDRDARLPIWCADDVWRPRWDDERAREPALRRAS